MDSHRLSARFDAIVQPVHLHCLLEAQAPHVNPDSKRNAGKKKMKYKVGVFTMFIGIEGCIQLGVQLLYEIVAAHVNIQTFLD